MPRSISAPPVLTHSGATEAQGNPTATTAAGGGDPSAPRSRPGRGGASALSGPPVHDERKARPYLPDKGRSRANLNGRVALANAQVPMPIHCRHLAFEYAHSSGKKADLLGKLQGPESIHSHFAARAVQTNLEAQFLNAEMRAPESAKRLIDSDHLGSYLAHVAQRLAEDRAAPSEANILLRTNTHAMAAQVQHKSSKSVAHASYFAVTLYEPNITGNHRRVEVSDLGDLDRLTLHHLDPFAEQLPATGSTVSMVAICRDLPLKLPVDALLPGPDGQNLRLAIELGMAKTVRAFAAALADPISPMPRAELIDLLEARCRETHAPALQRMLAIGDQATVSEYAKMLGSAAKAHGLRRVDLAHLLSAKAPDGTPALHKAVSTSNTQGLAAFAHALNALDLAPAQKAQLLAACDSHGKSALHRACELGRASFIDSFAEVLRGFGDALPGHVKAMLFDAVGPDGVSGRQAALNAGHRNAVAAYDRNCIDFR
jgi:ShET2 enterotoxin, N-terminal region